MRMPCVVVGAGAAGLAVSKELTSASIEHVVLERRDVADSWRNQRWDNFRLNTPGAMNATLGDLEPTTYSPRDEVVRLLADQAAAMPVRTQTPVTAVDHDGSDFLVRTPDEEIRAATVVLACGLQNVPKQPARAEHLSKRLVQLHTGGYRNAAQLPPGAVLVVGAAQSGAQIAEDLVLAGRRVCLSTSRVGRFPARYRGRELIGWLHDAGFWDVRPRDLEDPAQVWAATPVIASGGRSLSLQILERMGVRLLGRFESADGERMRFDGSTAESAAFADATATRLRAMADAHIAAQGVDAPPAEPDLDGGPVGPAPGTTLDLAAADVTSVIWCTGFTGDLSWVHLPILDDAGRPLHDGCASPMPGLWFVGFPWLTRRGSGILNGFPADAADVVAGVIRHLA